MTFYELTIYSILKIIKFTQTIIWLKKGNIMKHVKKSSKYKGIYRRSFLKMAGLSTVGLSLGLPFCAKDKDIDDTVMSKTLVNWQTDENGNTIWEKTYGDSTGEEGYSVQQTNDGGYIIVGYTDSFGSGEDDVWLIKTDENGDSLWTKTFGGSGDEEGFSVDQTVDGGYIIAGYTTSFGAGEKDVWLQ